MVVKLATYNSRGNISSRADIVDVLADNDIIALQEHWLPEDCISELNDFHKDTLVRV